MELKRESRCFCHDTSVLGFWKLLGLDRPLFSNIGHLVEHLGRGPLAQGLLGSLVYVLEFPFHIPLTCCSPHNPALTGWAPTA